MSDYDQDGIGVFDEIAAAYSADPEFRRAVDGNPREALARKGLDIPPEVEVRVWVDTPGTMHLIMPPDPNSVLSDETLGGVAGGARASTASSWGCASTASTIPSCFSSAGSVSSAGSAIPD